MKNILYISIAFFLFISAPCFSQEICDNGIDDDGDTLIDLNDTTDCQCNFVFPNIIPNPSFEQMVGCPTGISQMYNASGWIQASLPTSDYYNTCGFSSFGFGGPVPPQPLPAGNGYVGFIDAVGWKEYIGSCLISPMVTGINYNLSFSIGFGTIPPGGTASYSPTSPFEVNIYGNTDCNNLPFNSYDCPTSPNTTTPGWMLLGTATVSGVDSWVPVYFNFTPSVDINAIVIGPSCSSPPIYSYHYMDDLVLSQSQAVQIVSDSAFCSGNEVLTAIILQAGNYTYQWYQNGVAIVGATASTYTITGGVSANFQVAVRDSLNSCALSNIYTSGYVPFQVSINGVADFCVGDTVSLSVPAQYQSFLWSTGDTSAQIQVAQSGLYSVVVGNSYCKDTAQFQVTAHPIPIVSAGPSFDICKGDNIQLQGSATGAGPTYTYTWTPIANISNYLSPTPFANPPSSANYTLIATSNGCSAADSLRIIVHTLPTGNAGQTSPICAGESTQLQGIAFGDWDSTATYSFIWSPSATLSDSTIYNPIASPLTTTTYSMVVHSSWGCVSPTYSTTVPILPNPIANAGKDVSLCNGDSIQLSASFSFVNGLGGSPVFFGWNSTPFLSDSTLLNPWLTPTQSGFYVFHTELGPCKSSDTIFVKVSPLLTANATASSQTMCSQDSILLFGTGGTSNSTYTWYPPTNLNNPTIAHPIAFPDYSTVYTLTISEEGCSRSDTVAIQVFPSPNADFSYTNPNLCINNAQIQFLANGANVLNYIWHFGDGSPISNLPNVWHTYTQAGDFQVQLITIGFGGCIDTSDILITHISPGIHADFTSNPAPQSPVSLLNNPIQFQPLCSGTITHYLWQFGDNNFATDINPVHLYPNEGQYNVNLIISDEYGCKDTANYLYSISIPKLFIPNTFTPNADGNHDYFDIQYDGEEPFSLNIYDRWGIVYFESQSPKEDWNGEGLKNNAALEGTYYYSLKIGKKIYNGHLLLMR